MSAWSAAQRWRQQRRNRVAVQARVQLEERGREGRALLARIRQLEQQLERLQEVILQIPGEPSQSQGVIDTAIRLLRMAYLGGSE